MVTDDTNTLTTPSALTTPPKRRKRIWLRSLLLVLGVIVVLVAAAVWYELQTSRFQAQIFSRTAEAATYQVRTGPSAHIRYPTTGGPYDLRMGYTALPGYLKRLQDHGFAITAQAVQSPTMVELADVGLTAPYLPLGLFLPYAEKDQAGLTLYDGYGQSIYQTRYPERIYAKFDRVPPLLTSTLLYIENKTLLDADDTQRNPAIEASRLGTALVDEALHHVHAGHRSPGASTLATQIEKFRHSTEGRTASPKEKLRQMLSASLRAYRTGEDTLASRRDLVVHYLNNVPLAARPGYGEIAGIGDGMWTWYGRSFDEVNGALDRNFRGPVEERAIVYKETLSLMISQRSPSYFLNEGITTLQTLTDSYLRLLARDGVIPTTLRDAALKVSLKQQKEHAITAIASPIERKGASAVRLNLADMLGVSRMYDLDRLDLTVNSTLDSTLQRDVTAELLKLRDPAYAKTAGLYDKNLLSQGSPEGVTYSFTLIERTPTGNKVRVQADNFDQPFDVNDGTKLDLGSTAKLRTLITYLSIIESLHTEYAGMSDDELKQVKLSAGASVFRQWAVDYLKGTSDKSLPAMLSASLERTYSANPAATFFTGGGLHTFENFEKEDNNRTLTVRDATRHSVNLVYIRLMRDIVRHYIDEEVGDGDALLDDMHDPRRLTYLKRFADHEGRTFMAEFYRKYHGKSIDEADTLLVQSVRHSPKRLTMVYRTLEPNASQDAYADFLAKHLSPAQKFDKAALAKQYERWNPNPYNLADRAFLAGVHPLELWMVEYLHAHPNAGWTEMVRASLQQREDAYQWLYNSRDRAGQNSRIAQVLEIDAFEHIHDQWKKMGYPFDSLVPSYATALGASADRPAALAEMLGILSDDGTRLPISHIDKLQFAAGTPYETALTQTPAKGERVLSPELAQLVRQVLSEVVSQGTARRVFGAYKLHDGTVITVGGKTGTGDNRYKTFARAGELTSERVVSRSGAFAFYMGDRYFGTVVAYVAGEKAGDYKFTSALPVQVLKLLAPTLLERLDFGPPKVPQVLATQTPTPTKAKQGRV
jgi:membrane peptidoglycan carboxypeptidase